MPDSGKMNRFLGLTLEQVIKSFVHDGLWYNKELVNKIDNVDIPYSLIAEALCLQHSLMKTQSNTVYLKSSLV